MLALVLFLISLAGCIHTPGPLYPLTSAAGGAVLIEDLLEDPECDVQETSAIEAAADLLNAPWNVLMQVVAFEASLWWGIGDAVVGNRPAFEAKFERLMAWLPMRYAGVPPSLHPDPSQNTCKEKK